MSRQSIGEYLCTVVTNDDDLWVVAEALDAIFDVFAGDETDPVVKEINLVTRLRAVVPNLKVKVCCLLMMIFLCLSI